MENFSFSKTSKNAQGNGQFSAESQGCIQASNGDPRTGAFHKLWVIADDTICSVNGVVIVKF